MSTHLVITLSITIICLCLPACNTIPTNRPIPPTVEIESVKALKLSLTKQELAFTLKISNPNTYDLPLQSLSFTASIDDSQVAQGISDERVTLPAQSDALLEVRVSTRLRKLLGQLLLFSTSDDEEVNYKVTGFVELANWPARIPFNVDGALENPAVGQ